MMASTEWTIDKTGSSSPIIRSVLAISGIYDLYPIRHTSANAGFRLDHGQAQLNSPLYLLPGKSTKFAVVWGALETPSFRSQSRALADAWDIDTRFEVANCHHYAVMSELANRDGQVLALGLDLIEGSRGKPTGGAC